MERKRERKGCLFNITIFPNRRPNGDAAGRHIEYP
jgi:hypothetical protein